MRALKKDISLDRVKTLLEYDPDTGIFRWKIDRGGTARAGDVAGSFKSDGYVCLKLDGKKYRAHRIAWLIYHGHWPLNLIDHRDRDPSNNRISNLREADDYQSARNRSMPVGKTSGVRGVHRVKDRYIASICINGRPRKIGSRSTKEEAAALYRAAAIKLHGEFIFE